MPDTETIPSPATPHDLLIAVRDVIRDNPERHNQRTWLSSVFSITIAAEARELRKYAWRPIPDVPADPGNPVCGTTACVAGWAVILGGNPDMQLQSYGLGSDIEDAATALLDLSSDQASVLFSGRQSREEVLECLNALIENPDTDLVATWQTWTGA